VNAAWGAGCMSAMMDFCHEKGGGYFSAEAGRATRAFYLVLLTISITYSSIAVLAPLIQPVCEVQGNFTKAPNPSFHQDPCRWTRYAVLLGMNTWEADMSRRIVLSIVMGSILGFERRRADRPAGIRTMAMVSLGACVFTIGSIFAFLDGTMGWDSSRVSAAIPSGVGFLGAASIWKGTKSVGVGPDASTVPEVHGLTTATSVWLAAAVGILCGGALYVPGLFATVLGIVYLRFAPRLTQDESQAAAEGSMSIGIEDMADTLKQPLDPGGVMGAGATPPVSPAKQGILRASGSMADGLPGGLIRQPSSGRPRGNSQGNASILS